MPFLLKQQLFMVDEAADESVHLSGGQGWNQIKSNVDQLHGIRISAILLDHRPYHGFIERNGGEAYCAAGQIFGTCDAAVFGYHQVIQRMSDHGSDRLYRDLLTPGHQDLRLVAECQVDLASGGQL
ncbi:hypothetical protein D3C81_1691730 [compost metagenome]